MGTTYWDYIRVEDLLALQGGVEGDDRRLSNDEVTFITVHQVFELWFKLVIRELECLRDTFAEEYVPEQKMSDAARSLDRIRRILLVANEHWTVMESLSTRDYLDFRDKLFPASGFQSAQMREMEILLGLEESARIGLGGDGAWRKALRMMDGSASSALERVERRLAEATTLKQAVDGWLYRTPIRGSTATDPGDQAVVDSFAEEYVGHLNANIQEAMSERLDARMPAEEQDGIRHRYEREMEQAAQWILPDDRRLRRIRAAILFIESYRDLPLLSWPREILERIVEVEQALLIFRQRHARMVERIIGRRVGTGGSSGVDYLDETAIAYRVFGDLWTARTFLLRQEDLPPLEDTAPYDF